MDLPTNVLSMFLVLNNIFLLVYLQFHALQTNQVKDEILKQLCSTCSIIRVVFATVAIGMGGDIIDIRQVIHVVPPRSMKAYFQETGFAGRDGKPSSACLFYNNRDIRKNRVTMQDEMRYFYSSNDICLRKLLLESCLSHTKLMIYWLLIHNYGSFFINLGKIELKILSLPKYNRQKS